MRQVSSMALVVFVSLVTSPLWGATLKGDTSGMKAADIVVLESILDEAGIASAPVSSTQRTVRRQAELMCDAAEESLEGAKRLYCSVGDKVLAKFDPQRSREENVSAMTAELEARLEEARELGCLNHLENDSVYAVDIGKNSVDASRHAALVEAGKKAVASGRIVRFFYPPTDKKAFHFEFKK